MFGNMMDMMGKLKDAQAKMEEAKKRLGNISVRGIADGGNIEITMTASRKVTDIKIDESMAGDLEAIQDLMIVAVNDALQKAEKVNESEMGAVAKDAMPGLGSMFGK